MNFAIAIEPGDDRTAHGIVVPDLDGCFSAGDTFEQALENAREAIVLKLEWLLDEGLPIPAQRPLKQLMADPQWAGWAWAVVGIDLDELDDTCERINVSMPRRVLRAIDRFAEKSGETRSGYLARAALQCGAASR